MENLTTETFKEKVFDYAQNEDWSFKGTKPAVIDFYADWCNSCKTLAPILEELSEEYKDIDFYNIDTEAQAELATTFNIKSIPSILLIPLNAQPQLVIGALPKEIFIKAINEVILGEKPEPKVDEEQIEE